MTSAIHHLHIERAYDDPKPDRFRVLVDRLWPRGVKKDDLRLDLWAKGIAPTTELRKWYGHEPAKFAEFANRYRQELKALDNDDLRQLLNAVRDGDVALITATKDVEHSGAMVLREYLYAWAEDH